MKKTPVSIQDVESAEKEIEIKINCSEASPKPVQRKQKIDSHNKKTPIHAKQIDINPLPLRKMIKSKNRSYNNKHKHPNGSLNQSSYLPNIRNSVINEISDKNK